MLRRLYDWVLSWADRPQGAYALFGLAFAESSFFPIPPDVLLIALALGEPQRVYRFALICTVGSVLGGIFGYLIGWQLMASVGRPLLQMYHAQESFAEVQMWFVRFGGWAVAIAGFTPIPYKVFTLASGAAEMPFLTFVVASIVGRAGRFYLVSALIRYAGPAIRDFIERYFNVLTILLAVFLVLGFVAMSWFR